MKIPPNIINCSKLNKGLEIYLTSLKQAALWQFKFFSLNWAKYIKIGDETFNKINSKS